MLGREDADLNIPGASPPLATTVSSCGAVLALQFGRRTIPYHSIALRCAVQQYQVPDVCFGSKADIGVRPRDVRFTPESGHQEAPLGCRFVPKADICSAVMMSKAPLKRNFKLRIFGCCF